MTPDQQMKQLLELVSTKTKDKKAIWSKEKDGFLLGLQHGSILLRQEHPESTEEDYDIILQTPDGLVVTQTKYKHQDSDFSVVEKLFRNASASFFDSFFGALIDELSGPEVIQSTTISMPPPLPKSPTPEQAQLLWRHLEGQWYLNGTQNTEEVRIDREGNYFVLNGPRTKPEIPTFKLQLLDCTSDLKKVEIAKDFVKDGRRLQVEVLEVSDNKLVGATTYDKRKLTYTRKI